MKRATSSWRRMSCAARHEASAAAAASSEASILTAPLAEMEAASVAPRGNVTSIVAGLAAGAWVLRTPLIWLLPAYSCER